MRHPDATPTPRTAAPLLAAAALAPLLGLSITAARATGQTASPGGHVLHPSRVFKFVLPDQWRQLTIPEARQLFTTKPEEFPADLVDYRNRGPDTMPFGNVDRWLRDGFDGESLLVFVRDGEVGIDEESMDIIRSEALRLSREGPVRREILALAPARIGGEEGSEALECVARMRMRPDARPMRSLELYLPTGGSTLVLVFRAWDDGFAAAEPRFRRTADSVVLARPARGRSALNDNLLQAALIGALVGMLLMILHKRRTRPPAPDPG